MNDPTSSAYFNKLQQEKAGEHQRVVLNHLPMVEPIAASIRSKLPRHVELDDLVDAGIMGLLDAASKYDPAKGIPFVNYAGHRIKGAIFDGLRELDPLSRDMRRRDRQIETARRELTKMLERTPTDSEIAERLGINIAKFRKIEHTLWNARAASVEKGSPAGSRESLPDWLCERKHLRDVVYRTMETLPERHQQVLILYYVRGATMKEISVAIGVNESRVSKIRRTALKKMDTALQAAGINSSWIV